MNPKSWHDAAVGAGLALPRKGAASSAPTVTVCFGPPVFHDSRADLENTKRGTIPSLSGILRQFHLAGHSEGQARPLSYQNRSQ